MGGGGYILVKAGWKWMVVDTFLVRWVVVDGGEYILPGGG